jgi:hypothetical protein
MDIQKPHKKVLYLFNQRVLAKTWKKTLPEKQEMRLRKDTETYEDRREWKYLNKVVDDSHWYDSDKKPWSAETNDEHCRHHSKATCNTGLKTSRQLIVDNVDVLWESVYYSTSWRAVKKLHWGSQTVLQYFLMQNSWWTHWAHRQHKRSQQNCQPCQCRVANKLHQ